MDAGSRIARFSTRNPFLVTGVMAALSLVLIVLVSLPVIWPDTFTRLHSVTIDTDPENMLSKDEEVRVFHDRMKAIMSLNDIVVVGVVNEEHPEGVFNTESLGRIYELTQYAKTLRGEAIGAEEGEGVVEIDVIAPSTVDNIEQGGLGVVRFEWLMAEPPGTAEEAVAVREKAQNIPFLDDTLVSGDGKAIALYLPLTSKDLSHRVYTRLQDKIAKFEEADDFYITGLPVAEDTFGFEMFKQMAISAPMAMLVIFILLLFFFRKLVLIISPMIVAMVSVIFTMGLLIVSGQTIHIMSSMIPIFIMPIAVLDSVHILSEFFDRYQKKKDRRATIIDVMKTLFKPMLFTSLTSTAGFASLALTPIPPVQVFGIFVAVGVMAAWFWTIVFVPAYVMFIPEKSLKNFGLTHDEDAQNVWSVKFLHKLSAITYNRAKLVVAGGMVAVVIAAYGISLIQINDNPTRWFHYDHPIRVADRVLNDHFGGTYMAYLALHAPEKHESVDAYAAELEERMTTRVEDLGADVPEIQATQPELREKVDELRHSAESPDALVTGLTAYVEDKLDTAEGDLYYGWEEWSFFIDAEKQRDEVFKQPESLRYIADLQDHLLTTGVVGKSNSLTDIVKTVHRELFEGEAEAFRVPDSANGVAQTLITYESSHRPHDLYHFVTPDYTKSSMWVQLKSGDNKDMSQVVEAIDDYVAANPAPFGITHDWFGLTYINVVWQEKMVSGMLQAFLGSFLVVLLMMMMLFRSGLWGLVSMIPLTVTIGLIYGVIGLVGKDYDMPVAVLSSLTLGLAVDFAIHFLARARAIYAEKGGWEPAHDEVFGEPARAIVRNVIVISVGFLPLLLAPLVPYNTVGVLLAAILFVSGGATLFLLSSILRLGERALFPQTVRAYAVDAYTTCVLIVFAAVGLVALNVHQVVPLTAGWLAGWAGAAAVLIAAGCVITHRRVKRRGPNATSKSISGEPPQEFVK